MAEKWADKSQDLFLALKTSLGVKLLIPECWMVKCLSLNEIIHLLA